jgi:chemotaxis protein MotB
MPAFNRQRGRRGTADHWPGFVDALSSLLLVIIFLLSMFVLAQVFLSQTLSGQDEELDRLNDTIAQLQRTLAMEREDASNMRLNLAQLSASLQSANLTREELETRIIALEGGLQTAQSNIENSNKQAAQIVGLNTTLSDRQQKLTAAQDRLLLLNQQLAALRQQLAELEAALVASELRDKQQEAVISDLGRRLNVALAQRVQELAGYRSEFFGKLREAIGNHPGIHIEGDRFVMQSEVLFGSASAELNPQGAIELDKLAQTLGTVITRIPAEVDWVLRVDGHTDPVPISTAQFPSNWELSTARATAVVRYLVSRGIAPNRLAAAGFGEFAPIVNGTGDAANRRNRRIEFKLTQR